MWPARTKLRRFGRTPEGLHRDRAGSSAPMAALAVAEIDPPAQLSVGVSKTCPAARVMFSRAGVRRDT